MYNVLVIGYVWPEPNSSAAGYHMLSLLRLFRQQGWQVSFASPAQQTGHQTDLSAEGVNSHHISLNCSSFDQFVAELQPDIVMFDRFMMEEQFAWRVEKQCPDALRVLDTEDLQSLRNARHQAVKQNRPVMLDDLCSDLAKREIAAILRSDLSLIISNHEVSLLQKQYRIDSSLLHHLPFMTDPKQWPEITNNYDQRKHFVMIGNFRHAPNWDSVLQMKQLWPQIRKQLKEQGQESVELHIYGAYPPKKATQLHNPQQGFLIKGWAEDAYQVLADARVCLAPLRFGAGIKGKLLDAMLTATPSVTTPIGAEAMHDTLPWPGAVAESEQEFCQQSVQLYTDQEYWQQVQQNILPILHKLYDGTVSGPGLINRLEQLLNNREQHRLDNFTGALLRHHTMKSTQYMSQWIEEKNRNQSDN